MFPTFEYTLDIFGRLYDTIPPLVPSQVKKDMNSALEQMRNNLSLKREEIEDTMIIFGKRIWSYRKAFDEFFDVYEGILGEKFLLARFSPSLKKRYQEFKDYGGDFRDLHSGAPAAFFEREDRGELCRALIDMQTDLRGYTMQAVVSTDKKKYEDRILEFQTILDDVEKRLDTLRLMADNEQEHPELATEIRSEVRSFEFGMCLLGAEHTYEAICGAADHFVGRKADKVMMR